MPPKPALAKVLEERMRTIGHFIGGREVKGTSGRFADVFEPMTGDVQAKVALASRAELRAAVENALAAQPEWGATNPQRRVRVLMKFLELVARDNEALAELLAREHGKTLSLIHISEPTRLGMISYAVFCLKKKKKKKE